MEIVRCTNGVGVWEVVSDNGSSQVFDLRSDAENFLKIMTKTYKARAQVFLVQDMGTNESYLWSLPQILEEINKDRSSEWTDYDESDYVEGWCEWVEGEYFSCEEIKKKYHEHDCWDNAQPYEFEEHGRRYHGWECGICGKLLQTG